MDNFIARRLSDPCTKEKASKSKAGSSVSGASTSETADSSIIAHCSGNLPRHLLYRSHFFKRSDVDKRPAHVSDTWHKKSTGCPVQVSEACGEEDVKQQFESDEFAFVQVAVEDTTVVHSDFLSEESDRVEQDMYTSWAPQSQSDDHQCGPSSVQSSPLQYVRNTFIHFGADEKREIYFWPTAPSVMMTSDFHTKYPAMEEAHIKGDCRPCAYFISKIDGCRRGETCTFCHLCPPGALKKKKKEKIKALKERDWLEKQDKQNAAAV